MYHQINLALFFVDDQQRIVYHSTKLAVQNSMLKRGKLPVRFPYSVSIRTNNAENYKATIAEKGARTMNRYADQ